MRDVPVDEDSLGIHEKLVSVLEQVIEQITEGMDNLKGGAPKKSKNIIGLFGVWGSGKSTIIKILQSKKKRDYKIFIFDSWSHKDDFIKRAFLLKLVEFLGVKDEKLKINKKEITIEERIKKRVIEKTIDKQPDIKITVPLFVVILLLILSLLGFNFFSFWETDVKLYIAIGIIVISVLLYIVKKSLFSGLISPFISGSLDVTDKELSVENLEFSNYEFQEMLEIILNEFSRKNKNKKLIIVLDNLDRVDNQTILRFIAMMQAITEALSERKILEKIANKLVLVIPIDRQRLIYIFSKMSQKELEEHNNSINSDKNVLFAEDFVEKLFPYQIEIPNIVQSNWRKFFKEKFNEAFGALKIKSFDLELISRVFLAGIRESGENLTPREIINFINLLALNYMYWEDKIDIVHQATYVALNKYNREFINNLEDNNIEDLGKNKIIAKITPVFRDKEKLYQDLLKQKFKTEAIYEIIYKEQFIQYLEEGNVDEANSLMENLGKEEREDIIRVSLDEMKYSLMSDVRTLGNFANVLLSLVGIRDIKKMVKEDLLGKLNSLLKNQNAKFDTIDEKSGKGIGLLLKEANNKNFNKRLIDKLIETVLKSFETSYVKKEGVKYE